MTPTVAPRRGTGSRKRGSRVLLVLLLATVLAVLIPHPLRPGAEAQIAPLTYELRAGAAVPVQSFADPGASWAGEAGGGASFGMDFAYTFASYAAAYAGFSQHRFGCTAAACGRESDLVATGFDLGGRFILGTGRVIPLIRAGMVTYRVEGRVPNGQEGASPAVSRRAYGVEAGLGLSIRLNRRFVLVPGLRYLRMRPRFRGAGALPIRSLIADVGMLIGF